MVVKLLNVWQFSGANLYGGQDPEHPDNRLRDDDVAARRSQTASNIARLDTILSGYHQLTVDGTGELYVALHRRLVVILFLSKVSDQRELVFTFHCVREDARQ